MIRPTDPEGIISTLSVMIVCFAGIECGRLLVSLQQTEEEKHEAQATYKEMTTPSSGPKDDHANHIIEEHSPKDVLTKWVILGLIAIGFGIVSAFWMPFNKVIWSLSFSLLCTGVSVLTLAFLYLVIERNPFKKHKIFKSITSPFIWLGMNSLAIYFFMNVFEIILDVWAVLHDGSTVWQQVYETVFSSWISNGQVASLLFSFVNVILWIVVAGLLYWKRIFIKI